MQQAHFLEVCHVTNQGTQGIKCRKKNDRLKYNMRVARGVPQIQDTSLGRRRPRRYSKFLALVIRTKLNP